MSDKKAKSAPVDKKVKLVRDSFSMPKGEYAAIESLKIRALAMQVVAKKSELLRAGLLALSAMDDASLRTMLSAVPTLKTGRPKKDEERTPAVVEAAATKAATKAPAAAPTRSRRPSSQSAATAPAPAAKPASKKAANPGRAPARKGNAKVAVQTATAA